MYRGSVPLLTKGPLVTFYGREQLLQLVSQGAPGKSLSILLLSSLLFQVFLILFKIFYSRKITNYPLQLRATLVEGVLNIYGLLIIIIMSLTACFYVIYHYLTIKHLLTLKAPGEADLMPSSLLILYLLTVFVVLLPYTQNFHLRSDPGI